MYGKRKLAGWVPLTLQNQPRCTVRTFNYSHAAGLGALYGLEWISDYCSLKTPSPRAVVGI